MPRQALLFFLVSLLLAFITQQTLAQTAQRSSAGPDLERLIERAKKDRVRVIVVDPQQASATRTTEARTGQSFAATMQAKAIRARERFMEVLAALPQFPSRALDAILSKSPEKVASWPLLTVAWAVVFLVIGWIAKLLYARWAEPRLLAYFPTNPEADAEKIGYLFARGALGFIGLTVQLGVAALLVILFDMGRDHLRSTAMLVVFYWGLVAGFSIFLKNLLAVDIPQYRTLRIGDREAEAFHSNMVGLIAFALLVVGLCFWMDMLGIDRSAHVLALGASQFVVSLLLSIVAIRHREDVANMLFGYRPRFAWSTGQRLIANLWHVPVILYFFAAWCVTVVRLLLGQPNAIGLVARPIVYLLVAIAVYGAYLLIVELVFSRSKSSASAAADQQDQIAPEETPPASETPSLVERPSYKKLAQQAGALFTVVFYVATVLSIWGINPFVEGGWSGTIMDVLIVAAMAYICWAAAKVAIDRKMLEEGGPVEVNPGEIGGAGASRLGTLLPLFANFLLILIAAIALMIILTELGIDATPLFAGAGVLGLAIGFGAQTLIRDIFSGVFFLIDDAFRQGEYIDVGDVKGTVETISLRSMQLRHHNGPLNTIPFGEIKNVQNFSRDWVMMKLPLRLTYDTDAEKVRKLINNYGKELLKHPQVGGDFLQPLKSQGVIQMDESAQIMRVKFMTKPGAQWVIRRMVLNGIRDLFDREGISFAHHEVTVRLAADGAPPQLTDEEKQAVGAAAQRIAARRKQEDAAMTKDNL